MSLLRVGLAVASLTCAAAWAADVDPAEAVHQMLDRMEQAWEKRDLDALDASLSDAAMLQIVSLPGRSEGPLILDKAKLLDGLRQLVAGQIEWHRYVERDVQVAGDLAFLRVSIADKFRGRQYQVTKVGLMAVQEAGQWKICFGMPLLVRPAVFVADVLKDSQAQRAGLQPGDRVTRYADREVASSHALTGLVNAHAGAAKDRKIPLVVRRGADELRFDMEPGQLGLALTDRLLPTGDAALVGSDAPHPVKERVSESARAVAGGDIDLALKRVCPSGFLAVAPGGGGKPTRLIPQSQVRDLYAEGSQQFRNAFDPSTMQLKDMRVIVDRDVALFACRVEVKKKDPPGEMASLPSSLEVYVKQNGQWWFAAALPGGVELGPPSLGPVRRPETQTDEGAGKSRGKAKAGRKGAG